MTDDSRDSAGELAAAIERSAVGKTLHVRAMCNSLSQGRRSRRGGGQAVEDGLGRVLGLASAVGACDVL